MLIIKTKQNKTREKHKLPKDKSDQEQPGEARQHCISSGSRGEWKAVTGKTRTPNDIEEKYVWSEIDLDCIAKEQSGVWVSEGAELQLPCQSPLPPQHHDAGEHY